MRRDLFWWQKGLKITPQPLNNSRIAYYSITDTFELVKYHKIKICLVLHERKCLKYFPYPPSNVSLKSKVRNHLE